MVMLLDRAPLERVRKLADGRIAAVYAYTGAEVGRPDLAAVNVYRLESEVFDQAAMASFGYKAITIGHPSYEPLRRKASRDKVVRAEPIAALY